MKKRRIPPTPPFCLLGILTCAILMTSSHPGSIRFVGSTFPQLRIIGPLAFRSDVSSDSRHNRLTNGPKDLGWHAVHNSRIDLRDHLSLQMICKAAFQFFMGQVLLTGELPLLELVGTNSFYAARTYKRLVGVGASSVELVDLPMLAIIEYQAFWEFGGRFILNGTFPLLERIAEGAFMTTSHVVATVSVALTDAPSLRCLGTSIIDLRRPGTRLVLDGEYPCLNLLQPLRTTSPMEFENGVCSGPLSNCPSYNYIWGLNRNSMDKNGAWLSTGDWLATGKNHHLKLGLSSCAPFVKFQPYDDDKLKNVQCTYVACLSVCLFFGFVCDFPANLMLYVIYPTPFCFLFSLS